MGEMRQNFDWRAWREDTTQKT